MVSDSIKLPKIDFSNLNKNNSTWEDVKNQVQNSLEEYGCFEALYDQIPLDLRKSVFHGLQQLFDLPLEHKSQNTSNKTYRGYIGKGERAPLYESLGIDDALTTQNIERFTDLMWPEGNPSFSNNIQCFSKKLSELQRIVREMVLESLGLEKYMKEHMELTNYVVRVQKYNGTQSQETKLGLTSHKDHSVLTILYQNEVKGLQVLTKDGEWITIQPSNSFIVIVGEHFHAWTNGRVHSPYHRVMMNGEDDRYSIGLFSIPKEGYIIKPPEEMVDEEHPLLFKPYDHDNFVEFYKSNAAWKSLSLKDYCGI